MRLSNSLADEAVVRELGARLAGVRLRLRLSQSDLANLAGVAKRTVERIEAGEPAVLTNVVRVLRALDLIGPLDALIPDATLSPIEQLEQRKKKTRKRASRAKKATKPAGRWTWGDER